MENEINTTPTILHGRIARRDLFNIMDAMPVGDLLCITHAQTARNAYDCCDRLADKAFAAHVKTLRGGIPMGPHCYLVVERIECDDLEKVPATKSIGLSGRITQPDVSSILGAMRAGDHLYITHDQTARNALAMFQQMPHFAFNVEGDLSNSLTVECL